MKVSRHLLKRHVIPAITLAFLGFSVITCSPHLPPRPFTQEEWEDWIIQAGVRTLVCILEPASCGVPEIEVDCWTEEDGIECCQAIASLQVDVPRVNIEFEEAFQSELSRFQEENARLPSFPPEIEWAVRVTEKIALATVQEFLEPALELAMVSEVECHAMIEERIREHYMRLFKQQYASEFAAPVPSGPSLGIPTLVPVVPFNPPMIAP